MPKATLIPVKTFCVHHNIELTFIHTLHRFGLVEIIKQERKSFIHTKQINELEKFIHLHRDLEINPEGIDAIVHLLQRVNKMKNEITTLQNRLNFYEPAE